MSDIIVFMKKKMSKQRKIKSLLGRISESVLVKVLSALTLALLLLVGGFVWHQIKEEDSSSQAITEEETLYLNFKKLKVGISLQPIVQVFGTPEIYKRSLPEQFGERDNSGQIKMKTMPATLKDYKESIFVNQKYFLQVITDQNDIIREYSITVRDKSLKPEVPVSVYKRVSESPEKIIDNPKLGNFTLSKTTSTAYCARGRCIVNGIPTVCANPHPGNSPRLASLLDPKPGGVGISDHYTDSRVRYQLRERFSGALCIRYVQH